MFSAVGTVSFEKMKFDLEMLANELLTMESSILMQDRGIEKEIEATAKLSYVEQNASFDRTLTKHQFVSLWLLVKFLNYPNYVFSAPSGETLSPAPALIEHNILTRHVGCSLPLEQSKPLISIIDNFVEGGYGGAKIDPFAYFYFIDHQTGTIRNQLDRETPFQLVEGLEDIHSRAKVEKSADVAKQFEGWAVSFKDLGDFKGKGLEHFLIG